MYEVPDQVRPFKGKTITAPPGMVYVPAGEIYEKSSIRDSSSIDTLSQRRVSLTAFFIDATEVSNRQYRKFVDWVADSVAVTDFIKDPKYFYKTKIKSKAKGAKDSTVQRINWSKIDINGKVPFWLNNDLQPKLAGMVITSGGKKILNKDKVKFTYVHVQAGGPNDGKSVTDTVSVVPDSNVWAEDFPNSQSDIYVNNYFTNKAFDNYPVVGVNWKQARAYANWRGIITGSQDESLKDFGLRFNLPTEAQWEYAASGGENNAETVAGNVAASTTINVVPSYINKKSKKNLPIANFKQGDGNYTKDGSTYTLPVKSYAPNSFGLYNMQGNVAEWTLDAYSPSAREFVDDLNPVLLFDAPDNDVDVMKRKVVRGGSWKDNAGDMNTATRNYEVQGTAHSYIGFRCVMLAPDLLTDQVKTRSAVKPPKKSKKTAKLSASAN
ncbi:SUMF1/EgtB/PvdO family nonheme iron enzyme [Mucilaginibacter sp. AW1-3]